jgi:hypothetical protein
MIQNTFNQSNLGREKRLIVTGTNKGGCGRTFWLLQVWDWLANKNAKVASADCDWHNASLTRFLPQSVFLNLADPDGPEMLFDLFREADVVLLDSPGTQHPRFWEWMADSGFTSLWEQHGIGVTVALIIEEDKDTVFQASLAVDALGGSANWLVVQNLKTSETTSIYDESTTRQKLLQQGAEHIVLDRLPWVAMARMQRMSLTVTGLLQLENTPPLEKERVRNYQTRMFQEFDKVSKFLLPQKSSRVAPPNRISRREVIRPRIAPSEV